MEGARWLSFEPENFRVVMAEYYILLGILGSSQPMG
jgi:hypothetical protein